MILHVKGTQEQVIEAARARGITLLTTTPTHKGTTMAVCDESQRLAVMYWFGERSEAIEGFGFPVGTVLLHN